MPQVGVAGAIAGAGVGLGGMGSMISAMNTPDGPQVINPEVAAWLQQQGIDLNRYQAELQGGAQDFMQNLAQYPLDAQKGLQEAYESQYGGVERGAVENAMAALRGEQTPLTQNLLAQYGSQFGGQRSATDERVNQMIAQSGVDPASPYAQNLRAQAQNQITGTYQQGAGNIMNTQAANALNQAYDTLKTGMTTNRMSGLALPETPMTARETQAEAQKYKGTYNPYLGSALARYGNGEPLTPNPMSREEFMAGQAKYGSTGNPYAPSSSQGSTQFMPQYMSPNPPQQSALRIPSGGGGSYSIGLRGRQAYLDRLAANEKKTYYQGKQYY